jgi:hypothetical protein
LRNHVWEGVSTYVWFLNFKWGSGRGVTGWPGRHQGEDGGRGEEAEGCVEVEKPRGG